MNWNYNYNFIESIGGEGLIKDHLVVNLNYQNTNGSGSWFDASGNGNTFSISGSLVNSGSLGWAFNGLGFQSIHFTGSYLKINGNDDAFSNASGWTVQALVYPEDNNTGFGPYQVLFGSNDMSVTYSGWGRGTPWHFGFQLNALTQSVNSYVSYEGLGDIGIGVQNWLKVNQIQNVYNNYYPLAPTSQSFFTIASDTSGSSHYFQENLVENNPSGSGTGFLPGRFEGGAFGNDNVDFCKFGWVNSSSGVVTRNEIFTAGFNPFKGTLRNLLIYNKKLSGAEIQKNYLMLKKGYLV